jgi:hypothetical protein
MATRVALRFGASALALVLACGGKVTGSDATIGSSEATAEGGQPSAASESATALDAGNGEATSDGGAPSPAASASPATDVGYGVAVVAAANAACDAPHGDPSPVADAADMTSRLARAWYLCSVTSPGGGAPVAHSIVFTADGRWQYLLPDASGNLLPARGIDNEGTYTACDSCGSIDNTPTWMIYGPPGPWFVRFESQPTRLRIDVATAGWIEWYVPLYGP